RAEEMPGAPETFERLVEASRASEGRGVALTALERGLGSRHAFARELSGQDPVPRGVPRVVGLRHRAEVLLEPGGVGSGDGEGMARLDEVEPHDARGRGGTAEGSDGRGGVPAARIVIRIQGGAEGDVDLEPGDVPE